MAGNRRGTRKKKLCERGREEKDFFVLPCYCCTYGRKQNDNATTGAGKATVSSVDVYNEGNLRNKSFNLCMGTETHKSRVQRECKRTRSSRIAAATSTRTFDIAGSWRRMGEGTLFTGKEVESASTTSCAGRIWSLTNSNKRWKMSQGSLQAPKSSSMNRAWSSPTMRCRYLAWAWRQPQRMSIIRKKGRLLPKSGSHRCDCLDEHEDVALSPRAGRVWF